MEEEITINRVERRKKFVVTFDRQNSHFVCSCHLLEFRGIICRHAILVLMRNGAKVFPVKVYLAKVEKRCA